jgi:polysaccharide export outer membrane protein
LRGADREFPKQVVESEARLRSLRSQIRALEVEETNLVRTVAKSNPALRSAQEALDQALLRYTEEHPKVKELRAALAALQKQNSEPEKNEHYAESSTSGRLPELRARKAALQFELSEFEQREPAVRAALQDLRRNEVEDSRNRSEYESLQQRRDELVKSRLATAGASIQMWRAADASDVARVYDWKKAAGSAGVMALAGIFVAMSGSTIARRRSRRICDEAALEEATELPVIATLGDLQRMTPAERDYWALTTLNLIENATASNPDGGLVCGIVSAKHEEGRSTWIDLLADAGLKKGRRVLVISRPGSGSELPRKKRKSENMNPVRSTNFFAPSGASGNQSVARISLTASVVQPGLRKQWQETLQGWKREENAMVLIELPPASTRDGLLLSAEIPNVLWLSASGTADAEPTRKCVTGLRNAGCRLVGAVLNHPPVRKWNQRVVARCFGVFVAMQCVLLPAAAQEPAGQPLISNPPAANSNALSGTATRTLAKWQQNLTLGPGDVFDIALYGQPDTLRQGMMIGPDGRMSFLQAHDFVAAGLTVDEMRTKLEAVLAKFHLAPRVIVVPTGFNSKKYFVLGNVVQKGAFQLDRPTTILEAVAKSHGFVSTMQQRNSLMLADLAHTFLVRRQPDGSFCARTGGL